jgi:hypothetical protein
MSAIAVSACALFWEDYYRVGNLAHQVLVETLSDALAHEMATLNGEAIQTIVARNRQHVPPNKRMEPTRDDE